MRVLIDPGHDNSVRKKGAIYKGMVEAHTNLVLASILYTKLTAYGAECDITRAFNQDITIPERVVESQNYDIFVSIHCNAFGESRPKGFEVLVYPTDFDSYKFAKHINNKVRGTQDLYIRDIKKRLNVGIMNPRYNKAGMEKVLVE